MHYYDRGHGPALLLIHGMFGDHLDWEPVLESLAERHRVIAVDLPGFGASERLGAECTPELFTGHLTRLLEELGIDTATVAGNSFGGQVAMSLALARPDLVDKAILIATGGLHRYTEQEIAANLERLSEQKLMQFTPAIHAALFGRLFALQGTQAQRRYIAKQDANLTRPDYPDYVRVLHGCMRLSLQLCLLERLPALRMPVLLIQGELDPVIRAEWVRGAHPRFRDARLLALPEVGHVPQLEAPSTVVEAIRGFTGSD